MDRRQFLLSAAAIAMPVLPAGNVLAFKVYRNGNAIGEHHVAFTGNGDTMTAVSNLELRVTLAGIPVFRYSVQATEKWQSGVFQSVDSYVNYNGDALQVHAEQAAGGYEVEGVNHDNPSKSVPRYLGPPDTLPLTYWNKAMLNATILNVQTAHSYKVHVNSPGWNDLPTASGGSLVAQRFDLTGKLVLSAWYDVNDIWSGLEFQRDGDISYRKITGS